MYNDMDKFIAACKDIGIDLHWDIELQSIIDGADFNLIDIHRHIIKGPILFGRLTGFINFTDKSNTISLMTIDFAKDFDNKLCFIRCFERRSKPHYENVVVFPAIREAECARNAHKIDKLKAFL